jgi:hypothetical protein
MKEIYKLFTNNLYNIQIVYSQFVQYIQIVYSQFV